MYFRPTAIISLPCLNNTLIPYTEGCYVPSLVEIGPVFLEKTMKMCKDNRWTDTQTDDVQQTSELKLNKKNCLFNYYLENKFKICFIARS